MDRLFSFVIVLLVGLMASPSVNSAKANWTSSYDGPNSGYCASAYPGQPIDYYLAKDPRFCPENQRSNTVRRKPPKSTPVKNQRVRSDRLLKLPAKTMSALGQSALPQLRPQKQACGPQMAMTVSPPKADMCSATKDVCFGPEADMS